MRPLSCGAGSLPAGEVKISANRLVTSACLGVAVFLLTAVQADAQDSAPVSALAQDAVPISANEQEMGRRIYEEGVLPSGAELTGKRFGKANVSGVAAACVNCHRRSGMGQVEGDIMVPPITGNFLYATRKDKQLAVMDPRVSKFFNQAHDPYTDQTLFEAINQGKNNSAREMNAAMPRYDLSEADLKVLIAYLKQLSAEWSPGVTNDRIRFATVITPDVEPARRKILIDMMQTIVRQKNGSTETAAKSRTRHHMTSAAEMVLGTERNWDLDVWELQGEPETWGAQLQAHYRAQPVFALVSGISNSTWQPMHDFCEAGHIPCWFPSVDVPVKKQGQYTFYFSGEVLLEAQVLAHQLLSSKVLPKRVIQIYRDDNVGRAASRELAQALDAASGIKLENRVMANDVPIMEALRKAQANIKTGDVVMYWLRDADVEALGKLKPSGAQNYFSSRLVNAENVPLSATWKKTSHLVYLYELPEKRVDNLDYFHAWLNLRKIPLFDEAVQSEVFFSFNFLTDITSEMLDNLYRDYLVERAETMINKREGIKSEQETRDRFYLGKPGDLEKKHGQLTADERVRIPITGPASSSAVSHGTTIYPHLSLGPEQRFASKGGYILQFSGKHGETLIDESGWIVP